MSKIHQENLNIFYGYRCNYSCEGCFSGSNNVHDPAYDPDINVTLKSIPILAEKFHVSQMLTLIGGEPFLYWDDRITPIAKELNKNFPGTRINIFTNGQLLGKNINKVFDLADQLTNFSLTITNHLTGCADSLPAKIWSNGVKQFLSHPRIVKVSDEHYHIKNDINKNIYFFRDNAEWKFSYKRSPDGKIKPCATQDPAGSMEYGCVGKVCSCTFEGKLYKCPNLATLKNHLRSLNQLDDPAWKKYLNYPAIDLFDINEEQLNEFDKSYGKPTEWCDMCPNNPAENIPWDSRTYPLIFTKKN